jgi:hypothetical protein
MFPDFDHTIKVIITERYLMPQWSTLSDEGQVDRMKVYEHFCVGAGDRLAFCFPKSGPRGAEDRSVKTVRYGMRLGPSPDVPDSPGL